MTGIVAYLGDETSYPYRRCDGDEVGLAVPDELIARLEDAEREHDAATEAIRLYIEQHNVPEIDLFELADPTR